MAKLLDFSFSYNITRPYPLKWFTPVTITVFCLLTILISYLNYATIAFDLDLVTSTDFNTTTADRSALRGLPDLLAGKNVPTCQPASLALSSQIFTNNSALKYEIIGIQKEVSSGDDNADARGLPSLTYSNNILEDCEITSVQLELSSRDRPTMEMVISLWGIKVMTYANCRVNTDRGPLIISLGNQYDYRIQRRDGTGTGGAFVGRISDSLPSLWWGISLLQTYYTRLARKLREQYVIPGDNDAGLPASRIRKAILSFPRNTNISDILDPHHMSLDWYTIYEKSDTGNGVYWAGNHSRQYASDLARNRILPSGWWAPAEKLAKSAYSTVLVDLGNSGPSNLLLDGQKLQKFTSDFNMTDQPRNPGPATRQYDPLSKRRTRLGATPATIQASYICNKPRRKSTGAIVWLVILADIVFLQALWVIYKLIIDAWVFRHVDGAENCKGCQGLLPQHKTENIKMLMAQIGAMGQAPSMRDHPTPAPAILPRPERK